MTIIAVNAALVFYTIPYMWKAYFGFFDVKVMSEYWGYWLWYDRLRIMLIVLSAIAMLRLYYVMLRTSAKGERRKHPLYHLLRKVVPYPMVLCASRFGATTYKVGPVRTCTVCVQMHDMVCIYYIVCF